MRLLPVLPVRPKWRIYIYWQINKAQYHPEWVKICEKYTIWVSRKVWSSSFLSLKSWIICPQSTTVLSISVKVNIMIRHDGAVMWHGDMTTPLVTLCTLLSIMSHEESRGWCHPPGRGGVVRSLALIIPASDPGLEAGSGWPGCPHSLHYRSGRGFRHTGLPSPNETKNNWK